MHEILLAALAPVLRDLRATGTPVPRIEDRDWQHYPESASAMLWDHRSGMGVWVSLDDPEPERVASVSDQVQEFVVEHVLGAPTNWPACPQHPDTHPLNAVVVAEVAVWLCPRGGPPISAVGSLGVVSD